MKGPNSFFVFWVFVAQLFIAGHSNWAQDGAPKKTVEEEQSAEVFLEEYTDEFQNAFFEALKQKGIQNYDRAINLLLECKELNSDVIAIDHELARTHFLDTNYPLAQQYAIATLATEPSSYWYLDNLMNILEAQGIPFDAMKEIIPSQDTGLRFNLAKRHFYKKEYKEAQKIFQKLENTETNQMWLNKIADALRKAEEKEISSKPRKEVSAVNTSADSGLGQLEEQLRSLLQEGNFAELKIKSGEAKDEFPLQPAFYYYHGAAFNGMQEYSKAIATLEEGLGYILEESTLEMELYRELAKAHQALGNTSKANSYLSKIKP